MSVAVRRLARRLAGAFALCLGVSCVLLTAWAAPAYPATRPTVAVLPEGIKARSLEERAPEKLVHRLVTDQLAALGSLRVVGYAATERAAVLSSQPLKGRRRAEALGRIGLDLGADVLVVVSVSANRGRWRVRSTLYDVPTGRIRTGPSGTVRIEGLWPLLASITQRTAESAGLKLSAEQLGRIRRAPTTDPTALASLGHALAAMPGTQLAESRVLDAVRRDPEFVEAHMELGRLYYARQDYALAEEAYEQVRALLPAHPYVDYNLGLTYRALGDYPRAIDAYERARRIDGADADVSNNLGIAYYLMGDLPGARDAFRQALALAPYDRRVRANLRTVEDALQAPLLAPAAAPPQPAAAGPAPAAARPVAPARAPPSRALGDDPQFYVDTATIYFARGEYERAMVDYERALGETPDDPRMLMQLGRTYQRLARHADAVASFNRVLEIEPTNAAAAEELDQALAALRLAQADPGGALAVTRMGMTEADLGQTYFRKGKRHFVRQEYADAVAAYTRALQFTPNDVTLLNSLGVAQYELGKGDEAQRSFLRALDVRPDDASAQANLEAIASVEDEERLRSAEDRGAFTLLEVQVDPALEPEVAYLDGNEFYAAGEYATAAGAYERAVQLSPEHGRAWNNLGATRIHLHDYAGAAAAFDRAAGLIDAPVVRTNGDRARLMARYAVGDREARTLLIALEADPTLDYRYRMTLAREAYNRQEFAAAAEAYEALAAVFADEPIPLNNLAASYFMLQQYDDAYAAIELALRRNPGDGAAEANRELIAEARYVAHVGVAKADDPLRLPDASIEMAYAAQREGDAAVGQAPPARRARQPAEPQSAEATFRRKLQDSPTDTRALRGLAGVMAAQGRWGAAADNYRHAAKQEPDDFLVAMAWGYAALRAQRAAEAGLAFRQAANVRPNSARARYNLAIAERRAGDVQAALVACRAAIELEPQFADAQYNLANLYLEAGMWDQAVAAFRAVLQGDETNVSAYNNLAIAHWRRGELDAALGMWRTALALDPGCTYAADNLNRFTKHAAAAGRT